MPDSISTTLGVLPVRAAMPGDAPALVALLMEAQAWMDERALHQWVPGAHDPALVEAMIGRGTAYAVEYGKRVIATVQILHTLPAHWPHISESFGYVSTLTVARDCAGGGVGAAVLGWAEDMMRLRGKWWSCLDCSAKNPRLRAYYERQGYSAVGEAETYPAYVERMYHKRLTPRV